MENLHCLSQNKDRYFKIFKAFCNHQWNNWFRRGSAMDTKTFGWKVVGWEFSGGPVIRTLTFYCREHRFNPWLGNWDPMSWVVWQKSELNKIFLNLFFNWRTIGLQCCVAFCHKTMWLSHSFIYIYIYTYIPYFLNLPLLPPSHPSGS